LKIGNIFYIDLFWYILGYFLPARWGLLDFMLVTSFFFFPFFPPFLPFPPFSPFPPLAPPLSLPTPSCLLLPPPASSSFPPFFLSSFSPPPRPPCYPCRLFVVFVVFVVLLVFLLNCDLRFTMFIAGPQLRPSTPNISCRILTTTIHA